MSQKAKVYNNILLNKVNSSAVSSYASALLTGGCTAKDVYGNEVIHHKGSIFRVSTTFFFSKDHRLSCSVENSVYCAVGKLIYLQFVYLFQR